MATVTGATSASSSSFMVPYPSTSIVAWCVPEAYVPLALVTHEEDGAAEVDAAANVVAAEPEAPLAPQPKRHSDATPNEDSRNERRDMTAMGTSE